MLKVKVLTPVRYKGVRYEIGTVLEVEEVDFNDKYFELIEGIEKEENEEIPPEEIDLLDMKVDELRDLAKKYDIEGYSNMKKEELIEVLSNLGD